MQGRLEEAIADLSVAVDLEPDNADIVCSRADLLADLLIWRKMEGKAPIVVSPRTLGLVALGVAGALLLGVGMCLSMVFGKLVAGIVVGLIGIVALLLLIPLAKGLKD